MKYYLVALLAVNTSFAANFTPTHPVILTPVTEKPTQNQWPTADYSVKATNGKTIYFKSQPCMTVDLATKCYSPAQQRVLLAEIDRRLAENKNKKPKKAVKRV